MINLSQICIYNPQRQSCEVAEKLFIVRKEQFDFLMKKLLEEKNNKNHENHLIIAQRGMGKTTLLKRIEVELHKDNYKDYFIPLLFPEEQYNLRNHGEFWLNCLEVLADALVVEKYQIKEIQKIESKIKKLTKLTDSEEVAEKACRFLMNFCLLQKRRPVLLIDNIELVFKRLSKHEHFILREKLNKNRNLIIIGAGVAETEDTADCNAPFHNFFKVQHLKELNFEEFTYLLKNLAILAKSDKILPFITKKTPRFRALQQLTGGNPRAAVMLFKLIVNGFSLEINDDLEASLDEITPLYKARFEDLSQQQQIIIDAIASHWDSINIKQLSQVTHYENNQLSPQLKRLVEDGWIEKTAAYEAKGHSYYISERFFNIWFLTRCSNLRRKKGIHYLLKFLEFIYGEDISISVQKSQTSKSIWAENFLYEVSLIELAKDNKIVHEKLKEKLFRELWDFKKNNIEEVNQDEIFLKVEKRIADEKRQKIRDEIESGNSSKAYKLLTDLTKDNAIKIFPSEKFYDSDEETAKDDEFQKSISEESKNVDDWGLSALSVVNQKKYHNPDNNKNKTVSTDEKNVDKLSSLGLSLFCQEKYSEAENVFKRAVLLSEDDNYSWFGLGISLFRQEKYSESEDIFGRAVMLNNKNIGSWYGLGQSLFSQGKYKEAEETFKYTVLLNKNYTSAWNMLGNLCFDYLNKPSEAENAYNNAIFSDSNNLASKFNLVFLYRDRLKQMQKAETMMNTIESEINWDESGSYADAFWLNKALFELYEKNGGVAKEYLITALNFVKDKLPQNTQNIWQRFAVITIGLNYGSWLLDVLKETGYDVMLSPYYAATQALEIEKQKNKEKAERYLKNKAIEISEPARIIIKKMKIYM